MSNGIAVFSLLQERDELPKNTSMYDFVLKVIPEDIKSELSVELIDEVFQYVTSSHGSSEEGNISTLSKKSGTA